MSEQRTMGGLEFEPTMWTGVRRGWCVSNAPTNAEYPTTRWVAHWRTQLEHPAVLGVGATPQAAVEDCLRQMRTTLAIVSEEVRVRVAWRDALTEALAGATA
jgi:hypothetical protein